MSDLNIWWIRRDIRLQDNPVLQQALAGGLKVLPVFIIDPHLIKDAAPKRTAFLFAALNSLSKELERRGNRLIVRHGEASEVIPQLVTESGARAVFAGEDHSPYARRRDERVRNRADLRWVAGQTVHHPSQVKTAEGKPYTVFTPFSRMWKSLPLPSQKSWIPPDVLGPVPALPSDILPEGQAPAGFDASEAAAQLRLHHFLESAIYRYGEERNCLDLDGTSRLSPYLRFGVLSPRQAAFAALNAIESGPDAVSRKGAETWLNELIWREFYQSILYHFPGVLSQAFNPGLRHIPWQGSESELRAWQEGSTGYPVVDAAMRQLAATGWMHNRGRMIAASFLVKDLLIDWREGERWFMRHLVDGDPAANNGGWQWTAGVGTDAAPYFRIFNPVLQGKKFDPSGKYVRDWVPELAQVPDEWIHTPWLMPPALQQAVGVRIGENYPQPIVDHAVMRERTLAAFRVAR